MILSTHAPTLLYMYCECVSLAYSAIMTTRDFEDSIWRSAS